MSTNTPLQDHLFDVRPITASRLPELSQRVFPGVDDTLDRLIEDNQSESEATESLLDLDSTQQPEYFARAVALASFRAQILQTPSKFFVFDGLRQHFQLDTETARLPALHKTTLSSHFTEVMCGKWGVDADVVWEELPVWQDLQHVLMDVVRRRKLLFPWRLFKFALAFMLEATVLQAELAPDVPIFTSAASFTLHNSSSTDVSIENIVEDLWVLGARIRSMPHPPFTLVRVCELALTGLACEGQAVRSFEGLTLDTKGRPVVLTSPYRTLRKFVWAARKNLEEFYTIRADTASPSCFNNSILPPLTDAEHDSLVDHFACPSSRPLAEYEVDSSVASTLSLVSEFQRDLG
ncbi:MAG: hypothetical protein KVP17_004843 [Porospora cf. gigantea B]|uniref:uncharacterized protein n=1 Tax=Porospora cf. gigantea B TaxID=2853592 RepID=UPI003571BDE6|nr:MAG: hypothetical protein KVP17_004843 [Porospora cf. gigantea B]